jgi:hypothetical protein
MSKRERKFHELMQASLLNLHLKGEISEYSLKVARDSVSYTYNSKKEETR